MRVATTRIIPRRCGAASQVRALSPRAAAGRPTAADHRRDDLDRLELVGRAGERVAREHHEIGEEPGQEPAAAALVAREPGRRDGRGDDRLLDRERLVRAASRDGRRSSAARRRGSRRAGRAPRPARPSRSRRRRRSRGGCGTRRCRSRRSPQNRSARSRSDGAWENWTEQATPSSANRGQVGGVEALRVLDPLPEAERLPGVLRRLEGVERVAVGAVADRVHRHGPAGRGRRAGRSPPAPRGS